MSCMCNFFFINVMRYDVTEIKEKENEMNVRI